MFAVETSRCPSCGAEPGVACKNQRTGAYLHGRPHKSRVKAHLRYIHIRNKEKGNEQA